MKKNILILMLVVLTPLMVMAQKMRIPFRVVGYYSLETAMKPDYSVPFKSLTHVNLWFLNADSLGHFTEDLSALKPFIDEAHRKKVQVMISIGGGSKHPQYKTLLADERRKAFIDALMVEVKRLDIDGIDVDLEGSDIDTHYEAFVTELGVALHTEKKLMTAAIAVYYKDQLSDRALAQFDFVNVMSYDRTGPWRPEKPGPHATYAHAAEDLEYFTVERKIPKEKITLGVPFYGYGFGPELNSPVVTMSFGQITETFAGAEKADLWHMPGGRIIYYNGMNTMRLKTLLARQKASGIMIWELTGDATADKSLLATILKSR